MTLFIGGCLDGRHFNNPQGETYTAARPIAKLPLPSRAAYPELPEMQLSNIEYDHYRREVIRVEGLNIALFVVDYLTPLDAVRALIANYRKAP